MHGLTACGRSLVAGWLLLLLLLLVLLQLVFVVCLCWDIGGVLFLFCAKIDNDRKIGNWKHRAFIVEYENIGEHETIVRLRI